MDKNDELENLIIKKSSEIGYLQNKIEEQSLLISKLTKLLETSVYEKLQITPSDKIFKKCSPANSGPTTILIFFLQLK